MARIIYSALVESIRGSIAGTTFQANAYGHTIKKKPNMIRPNSQHQQLIKSYLSQATALWLGLDSVSRATWTSFAIAYPQYAKKNPASQLSAQAVFCKEYVQCSVGGKSFFSPPVLEYNEPDVLTFSMTLDDEVLTLSYVCVNENGHFWLNFFLTPPLPSYTNFIGSKTRYIFTQDNESDDVDISALYLARFGKLPEVGQSVGIEYVQYGKTNAQVLSRVQSIVVVAAVA